MTCIAAIIKDGKVHMAADSSVTLYSNEIETKGDGSSKIFVKNAVDKTRILMGSAGASFATQVLQYKFTIPAPPKRTDAATMMRWFAEEYVSSVKRALSAEECMTPSKEGSPTVRCVQLVGIHGRLYTITSSLAVIPAADEFASIGSGYAHAQASLFTSDACSWSPRKRLKIALTAAERWVTDVRGPFEFKTI